MKPEKFRITLCYLNGDMHIPNNKNIIFLLGNVVISKKILRTRKIMVIHSNERGECVHIPL